VNSSAAFCSLIDENQEIDEIILKARSISDSIGYELQMDEGD